jgi:glutamate formiminotransferase
MDPDHHRSVITFAGPPESVGAAAVRAVAKAAELIDLTRHAGVHPRLGAADVIPFVPVEGITLEECVELAHRTGEEIWAATGVPVYFYEAAARVAERQRLENVRRGQFEGVRDAMKTDAAWRPDVGGPVLHPTAGAAIVGARKFLIAWNVNLDTRDLTVAQAIARRIRASSGGFAHLKALGLALPSRGQTQVSMNLTDYTVTPMHIVFNAIRTEAFARGVSIAGTEIIGLIPREALEKAAADFMLFENFQPDIVLESRIDALMPVGLEDVLDEMSEPARATGGGSAAAVAGAMAAALGILVCRLTTRSTAPFEAHREFFTAAVAADAAAFAALMRTAEPAEESVVTAAEVPLGIAERAVRLRTDLETLAASCPARFASDVETALGLAGAAIRGGASTATLNIRSIASATVRKAVETRLRAL